MKQFSYCVDLRGQKFDEAEKGSWLQAMPVGDYKHPIHGPISITTERIKRFAENVVQKVRGTDLDIDYDHKQYGGDAAGWVKNAADRGTDGLWLFVEWTPSALKKLMEGAYRYFSPEFVDEWEHPATGNKYQDVLFGGGLTNRPFLKDIRPLNFSEIYAAEGGSMTPEQIKAWAARLGLDPETATLEMVMGGLETHWAFTKKGSKVDPAAVPEAPAQPATPPADPTSQQPGVPAAAALPVAAHEVPADLKQLAETNPGVKALMEAMEQQSKRLAEVETARALSEVTIKLSEFGKAEGHALTPVFTEAVKKHYALCDTATRAVIVELAEIVAKGNAVVKLGEQGASNPQRQVGSSGSPLLDEVKKLQEADKALSFNDAVSEVIRIHPEWYDGYRRETYIPQS